MAGGRLFAGVGLILIGCAPAVARVRPTALGPPVYLSQRPPVYPSMLQSQGVEGIVAYAVRVMPDGRADVSTFRVDTASHPLFAVSVKNAVPRARWEPAPPEEPQWFTHVVRWVALPADSAKGNACPPAVGDTTVVCARREAIQRRVLHD